MTSSSAKRFAPSNSVRPLFVTSNGDALQALTSNIPPTDVKQFAQSYELLLYALSRLTSAKIVV